MIIGRQADKFGLDRPKRQSFFSTCCKRFGFTLAEVLIVVGIIGMVAELTIPTLLMDVQKQVYAISLKKIYTEGNQALSQMTTANGCTGDLACTGLFASGGSTSNQTLGDELVKYFNVARNCQTATTTDITQACWPMTTNLKYDGTGSNTNWNNSVFYKFITADGMSVSVFNQTNDCSANLSNSQLGYLKQNCGQFFVDVNGLKGPNRYGRDTFVFFITNGKGPQLYPAGGQDHASTWQALCATNGLYCAGRILEEGWQMNY